MLPVQFRAILRPQPFSSRLSHTLISHPRGRAPFIIFARDCFHYSLFGQNMLSVRIPVILRGQAFSRAQSCTLISRPPQERSIYNFRVRPLPIFIIWPKYAIHTISRDYDTSTFFARAIAHANILALPEALYSYFSRTVTSRPSPECSFYNFRA